MSSHEILVASFMDQLDYTVKQFAIIISPILNLQSTTWIADVIFVLQKRHWINAENISMNSISKL